MDIYLHFNLGNATNFVTLEDTLNADDHDFT